MRSRISIRLAESQNDFLRAFQLLTESRRTWDPHCAELWLLKQHALPTSNIIVALLNEKIVGALCLFGESPFGLPLENKINLSSFKESIEGRIAEISAPGILQSKDMDQEEEIIVAALYNFALKFGATFCRYDAFLTKEEAWTKKYTSLLDLHPLPHCDSRQRDNALLFGASSCMPKAQELNERKSFLFPEKKFFFAAKQSMIPETIDLLFNKKTHVFKNLTDAEIRILKNIYNHGEYAKVIPDIGKVKIEPKHRRFLMNCHGFLKNHSGEKINFQVIDVSKEGLKIKAEELLQIHESCMLNISIGVMKNTEVIASAIWVNEENQTIGLLVKSGDKNWRQLIEYLESSVAA